MALLVGVVLGAWAAWQWQGNAYARRLAEQGAAHRLDREVAAVAALEQLDLQQTHRRELEDRLKVNDQTHYKELNDAQQAQARLRDRLAAADLRLSVLLDASTGCDSGMRAATGAGSVVHGVTRAKLDPAHARRIISITDAGDQGLIALRACQAYVREIAQ
nr:lysis system i-spanin subunit Rz [Pseudomonas aegrilactucae]